MVQNRVAQSQLKKIYNKRLEIRLMVQNRVAQSQLKKKKEIYNKD